MTQILSRMSVRLLLSNSLHLQVFPIVCSEIWVGRSCKNCHIKATGKFFNGERLDYSLGANYYFILRKKKKKTPKWV